MFPVSVQFEAGEVSTVRVIINNYILCEPTLMILLHNRSHRLFLFVLSRKQRRDLGFWRRLFIAEQNS